MILKVWLFLTSCATTSAIQNLRLVKQWAYLEFEFPSEEEKVEAMLKQMYIPGNAVPVDVDVYYKKEVHYASVFVTTPRIVDAIPVTVGVIGANNKIIPYPDYTWHRNDNFTDCDKMTSVFRIMVDSKFNKLWIMDTGKRIDVQVCPPQLLAFDLNTDLLVYRHRPDKRNYKDNSLFVTPVVDSRNDPLDTFVYVADVTGYGLLVVDVRRDMSWRVECRLFHPYPNRAIFDMQVDKYSVVDGIMGMTISPMTQAMVTANDRLLYFHALASTTENFVPASVIRNPSVAKYPMAFMNNFQILVNERRSQSCVETMDEQGVMYFSQVMPAAILCWNSSREFSQPNFYVLSEDEALNFVSGMKVVENAKGEQELWVMTSSFERLIGATQIDKGKIFKIHGEKISTIRKKTGCGL